MPRTHSPTTNPEEARVPKKPANLSVRVDLLGAARDLGLNLSATLEAALVEAVRVERRRQWLARNRQAIEAYNDRFEGQPLFSDGLRSF